MRGFPPELVFIFFVGAFLLLKFLKHKAARQRQGASPPPDPPEDEIPETEWNAAPVASAPRPQPAQGWVPQRRDVAPAAPAQARSRLRVARQSLFGARWDVQEAVVVATILGRCRADEPHDIR
jgi:hypothetical protein